MYIVASYERNWKNQYQKYIFEKGSGLEFHHDSNKRTFELAAVFIPKLPSNSFQLELIEHKKRVAIDNPF
ncbi:hypothetical protein GCM10026987_14360 [Belliella aquatica]|uniref:Uncharacterized protein n=1 Tax=Belliella aquatica TaxID=1323734 RepID=A0ABQ1LNP0_9BACT|nr:hypothetical protein GCM10010993_01820 [Belliella aquatica]